MEIGDRVQPDGRLLGAVAAVEVAADADVPAIARQLADVVDVVRDRVQTDDLPRIAADLPSGVKHPGVQGHADDRAAPQQPLDLLVGKLAVTGHQRPAVVVAGHHRPPKAIQGLEEAGLGEMGHVENHAQLLELSQELDACPGKRAGVAGADGVAAPSVVGEARRAEPVAEPGLGLRGLDDGVGPFHGQDGADRQAGRVLALPPFPMDVQLARAVKQSHLALLFQQPVVSQLALSDGAGDLLIGVVDARAAGSLGRRCLGS